jgi:hypothetical protein
MQKILEQAIKNQICMKIIYNGGERIIEPHCLGISSTGKLSLRCWQRSGFSRKHEPTAWKFMTVNKIEYTQILEITFTPHKEYRRGDKMMKEIICQI